MIPRYDLIIDIHLTDDAAMMRRHDEGDYVLHEDYKAKQNLMIDAIDKLMNSNITNSTIGAHNEYLRNLKGEILK